MIVVAGRNQRRGQTGAHMVNRGNRAVPLGEILRRTADVRAQKNTRLGGTSRGV
jgi:hypothetical protein